MCKLNLPSWKIVQIENDEIIFETKEIWKRRAAVEKSFIL